MTPLMLAFKSPRTTCALRPRALFCTHTFHLLLAAGSDVEWRSTPDDPHGTPASSVFEVAVQLQPMPVWASAAEQALAHEQHLEAARELLTRGAGVGFAVQWQTAWNTAPCPDCGAPDVPQACRERHTAIACTGPSLRAATRVLQDARIADDVIRHTLSYLSCASWRVERQRR